MPRQVSSFNHHPQSGIKERKQTLAFRLLLRQCGAIAVWLALGSVSFADTATDKEALVKSAYIYHFTQYVLWPQMPDSVAVCAPGAAAFAGALKGVEKESTPQHPVEVRLDSSDQQLSSCHLVYVAGETDAVNTGILASLRELPILTVGEGSDFIDQGGMIAFVKQKNRIQLEVNLRAAERVGLKLDPQLLEVARRVIR